MSVAFYKWFAILLMAAAANAQSKFNKPAYFYADPAQILSFPFLRYDLTEPKGRSLLIGKHTLSPETWNLRKDKNTFVFKIPSGFFMEPQIEFLDNTGKVFFQIKVWRNQDSVVQNIDSQFVKKLGSRFFKYCISEVKPEGYQKLCSQQLESRIEANTLDIYSVPAYVSARILMNGKPLKLKDKIALPANSTQKILFKAEFAYGETYEWYSQPSVFEILDISDAGNPENIRIMGYGSQPLDAIVYGSRKINTLIAEILAPTVGDLRENWIITFPQSESAFDVLGATGGVFYYEVNIKPAPPAKLRIVLDSAIPKETYASQIPIKGRKQRTTEVSSDQVKIEAQKNPTEFVWTYAAPEKGKLNRSYLNMQDESFKGQAYYEIYRGFANELSIRSSFIVGNTQALVSGEVSGNHWFEDVFGWRVPGWTLQRWGIGFNSYQSFNSATESLSGYEFDLKYRFTQGLWTRDETFGATANYNKVKVRAFSAAMIGPGLFWARSMPKGLDDLLNHIPFLRAPKWIHLTAIYYTSTLDSNVTLNTSASVQLRAQVLWSKQFFGEIGMGYRKINFTDTAQQQEVKFETFNGTLGLGFKF